MKKILFCLLLISISTSTNSMANTVDFDTVIVGFISNYHISNGKYYFDFDEGEGSPESYSYTGMIDDDLDKQVKKFLKEIDRSKQKIVAIKYSMNRPVSIQIVEENSLYIQPNSTQRDNYAIIDVCISETDDCWKLKVLKNNPQYNEIITSLTAKEVTAYYTKDNELVACCSPDIHLAQDTSRPNITAVNTKSIFSDKLTDIFTPENINVNIQYFDKKYGPAKINNGSYREYDIDGCKISITGNNDVESISLVLSQQCNINMSRFLGYESSAYGMTFGDFEQNNINFDYSANCFAGSCGDMVNGSVEGYAMLPRSLNFLELKASVTIDNNKVTDDASSKAALEISKNLDKNDSLRFHTSFCSKRDSDIIKKYFKNMKIDTITLGYNLKTKCEEDNNEKISMPVVYNNKEENKKNSISLNNRLEKQKIISKFLDKTIIDADCAIEYTNKNFSDNEFDLWFKIVDGEIHNNPYKMSKDEDDKKVFVRIMAECCTDMQRRKIYQRKLHFFNIEKTTINSNKEDKEKIIKEFIHERMGALDINCAMKHVKEDLSTDIFNILFEVARGNLINKNFNVPDHIQDQYKIAFLNIVAECHTDAIGRKNAIESIQQLQYKNSREGKKEIINNFLGLSSINTDCGMKYVNENLSNDEFDLLFEKANSVIQNKSFNVPEHIQRKYKKLILSIIKACER